MSLQNMKESVTLSAESLIEDKVVAIFTAYIPNNGIPNSVNPQIRDVEAYNEHRDLVRQDQRDFQNAVWDKEDEMNA